MLKTVQDIIEYYRKEGKEIDRGARGISNGKRNVSVDREDSKVEEKSFQNTYKRKLKKLQKRVEC